MIITFPTNCTEVIDDIRGAIGRTIQFYIPTISGCYNCSENPITNKSINSFCPVCSGEYWIKTYNLISVSGHVTWGPSDILNWQTGGKIFDGDCRVSIKLTEDNITYTKLADFVDVDGKKMKVKKVISRGVPQLNRLLVDMVERDEDL
jgi:hypothetical protein